MMAMMKPSGRKIQALFLASVLFVSLAGCAVGSPAAVSTTGAPSVVPEPSSAAKATASPAEAPSASPAAPTEAEATESPTEAPSPAPLVSYTDPSSGVTLKYPQDWTHNTVVQNEISQLQLAEPTGYAMLFLQASPCPDGTVMFDQATDRQYDKYVDIAWKSFATDLATVIDITGDPEIADQEINGRDFITYQVDGTIKADQTKCRYFICIGLYDGNCYIFGYALRTAASLDIENTLQGILSSFAFGPTDESN